MQEQAGELRCDRGQAGCGGAYRVTEGLMDRFGPERVADTPISEAAIAGAASGAAMTGLRPVAEFQFNDFHSPVSGLLKNIGHRIGNGVVLGRFYPFLKTCSMLMQCTLVGRVACQIVHLQAILGHVEENFTRLALIVDGVFPLGSAYCLGSQFKPEFPG